MYRIQAIILYRQKIRDHQIRTILFCEEYGKISAWEKGGEYGDIGDTVEVLIERKNGHNQIKKMEVITSLSTDSWIYEEVIEYLSLLKILYEALPEGTQFPSLYTSLILFIKMLSQRVGKVGILILMQSRILKILGYLNQEYYTTDEKLFSLYKNINLISMKSMFTELAISEKELIPIKKSILEACHTYSYRN